MFPINIQDSPTAHRFRILFSCDHCGSQSIEALSRLHSRYQLSCRECYGTIDIGAKENRIFLEEAVELCRRADARLKHLNEKPKSHNEKAKSR